ncbi:hypothetical protein RHECNPAF_2530042 [Rhizobium etli CNPAF512]|nr:hypothetical protein RHECNPAF_2530042 [Rhizobium etli CNPAF512]
MEGVGVDEIAVGREAGIVPVFDVAAGDLVTASIGALPVAAGLVITAVGQKLVADLAVIRHPHADIGMVLHSCSRLFVDASLTGLNIMRSVTAIKLPISDGLVRFSNQWSTISKASQFFSPWRRRGAFALQASVSVSPAPPSARRCSVWRIVLASRSSSARRAASA